MPNPVPTAEDRKNYSVDVRLSPFFSKPEEFLKLGQRVRANHRIFDLPNDAGADWGWVSAEKDEQGTVVHVEAGYWPTVRFDGGKATCVTDTEVSPL